MRNKELTRREFITTATAGLAAASVVPARAPAVSGNPNALALNGGTPVRSKPYPKWPQTSVLDEQNILKALRNHRWCTFDSDYGLRLKKEFSDKRLWVAGYSNDVMGYIPSLRVLREGGYEGGDAMIYYGQPGPWAPSVEETIVTKVHQLVERVQGGP
jgi:hypothetical protein